jgi:hypothetical protein
VPVWCQSYGPGHHPDCMPAHGSRHLGPAASQFFDNGHPVAAFRGRLHAGHQTTAAESGSSGGNRVGNRVGNSSGRMPRMRLPSVCQTTTLPEMPKAFHNRSSSANSTRRRRQQRRRQQNRRQRRRRQPGCAASAAYERPSGGAAKGTFQAIPPRAHASKGSGITWRHGPHAPLPPQAADRPGSHSR